MKTGVVFFSLHCSSNNFDDMTLNSAKAHSGVRFTNNTFFCSRDAEDVVHEGVVA